MQIKVYGNGMDSQKLGSAIDGVLSLARDLDKKFSIYDPESEVNKLNMEKMRVVSLELFNLINKAKRVSHITGGAFDITIAPILKANGFYKSMPAEVRDNIPTDLGGVGVENVTLRLDSSIRLRNNAWVDLSGIAKGAIVDHMKDYLKKKGVKNILINAGGDIYCGEKKEGKPWLIGLREPGTERVLLKLTVKNMAVATSGDYENVVVEKDTGEMVSHIVDPFNGKAKTKVLSSVTVIAPDCADADALATGMMVMDADRAIALADEMKDVAIIVVTGSGKDRKIDFSEGAEEYLARR
jgi:thiamine biosynthesis lipoprotein